jgi:hypothetical protein
MSHFHEFPAPENPLSGVTALHVPNIAALNIAGCFMGSAQAWAVSGRWSKPLKSKPIVFHK